MGKQIKVGTRGSALALAQADLVIEELAQANPDIEFSRKIVTTTGDIDKRVDIASLGYGVFVSELENALASGDVDIAVHSMKDMPSTLDDRFQIAAVPYREDPRDVIVSKSGLGLKDLPHGSIVATGSARRKTLLLDRRPDLQVVPIRGNVPTRLEKLDASEGPDALVLAAAGLNRLRLADRITEYLACGDFVAAVSQGALAIETRVEDDETAAMAAPLEHTDTRSSVDAERVFLSTVEGGCSAPVSAHARIKNDHFSIHAFAGSIDGSTVLRAEREGDPASANELARDLAEELLARGAADLVSGTAGAR